MNDEAIYYLARLFTRIMPACVSSEQERDSYNLARLALGIKPSHTHNEAADAIRKALYGSD